MHVNVQEFVFFFFVIQCGKSQYCNKTIIKSINKRTQNIHNYLFINQKEYEYLTYLNRYKDSIQIGVVG